MASRTKPLYPLDQLYYGQSHIVRVLEPELLACMKAHLPIPHLLFYGPPGTGKDHLVHMIAKYSYCVSLQEVLGRQIAAEGAKWDWKPILDGLSSEGCDPFNRLVRPEEYRQQIIFLNECQDLPRGQGEVLHGLLQPDNQGMRRIMLRAGRGQSEYTVPPFTMIFATNYLGAFQQANAPLIDRCRHTLRFEPYTPATLQQIVRQHGEKLGVPITINAAAKIAERARGSARIALHKLFDSCHKEMMLRGEEGITEPMAIEVLERLGIEDDGLTRMDSEYLRILATSPGQRLSALQLATRMQTPTQTLWTEVEEYMIYRGYIEVASGVGRCLTDLGRRRVGQTGGLRPMPSMPHDHTN